MTNGIDASHALTHMQQRKAAALEAGINTLAEAAHGEEPYRRGLLRGSQETVVAEDHATVGYTMSYAGRVHEELDAWLARSVDGNAEVVLQAMADELRLD